MSKHGSSCGGCTNCGTPREGCCGSGGGTLLLCDEELLLLSELSKYAFLPMVQFQQNGELHYYPAWEVPLALGQVFSAVLTALERKRVVSVDPDLPLSGADYSLFSHLKDASYGSIAYTRQGQEVADWLAFRDSAL